MSKLRPSRFIALDRVMPDECTVLWSCDDPPFYVAPRLVPTCMDLAGVLRMLGFPSAEASKVMDAAVAHFGAWIKNTPNVAMNFDGDLEGGESPFLLFFVIDTGATVESGGQAEMIAAQKFIGFQLSFHEADEDEKA